MEDSAFFEAIKSEEIATVRRLLDAKPALVDAKSAEGLSPVLIALYYGKPDIAQLILERDLQPDIFDAAASGDLDIVKKLVGEQPELVNAYNVDGFQPLGLAAFFGREQVAEFLLERGAEVNSASQNSMRVMPLHSAAASQNLKIARSLLEHGADPNASQSDEFRPIHEAAQNGQLEMVQLFLEYGADPALPAANGKNASDYARESGNQGVISLLTEND